MRHERFVAVNKPSCLLTIPGKGPEKHDSVLTRARALFPAATGSIVMHRLDWETSGVLLLALDPETHRRLGRQFEKRTVRKVYVALLAGVPAESQGEIRLPVKPDWNRRPYQVVDHDHGREAITAWCILGVEERDGERCARVEFRPRTGRTHQLRVHAAVGLGLPILGDGLYGSLDSAERLMLHAASLEFMDPVPHGVAWLKAQAPVPF
ncbi:MAG: RluA family pseudouridine synthase [Thermoleophilia bacterium]|nr:RluA family pseudouridine synthase [Thermoleophilia bacterium]